MDLHRQFKVVRAWLPLLIASVALAGVAGYYVSGLQPKVFEAKATLIVGQALSGVSPAYDQLLVSQNLASTYASVATTPAILAKVIDTLGLAETPGQLARRVSVEAASGSAVLTITAQNGDPVRASALANTLSKELIAISAAPQGQHSDVQQFVIANLAAIQVEITDTQSQIALLGKLVSLTPAQEATLETLQGRLVTLQSTYAALLATSTSSPTNNVSVVQPAITPESPVAPRPLLTAMLAAMVAFLFVAAIAFVRESLNDTISDPDQVQEAVGLATLGAIARMSTGRGGPAMLLAAVQSPSSPAAEAYRTLRANVEFASLDQPIRTLLVTSALPSEGKTVTAANLAAVFAQGGRRVLLVDADLRQPGAHELFALPNTRGLTTLVQSDSARLDTVVQRTEESNLHVLSTGPLPPNPAEVLGSKRMHSVVASLSSTYDLVVFDSPPLEVFADSAVLSSFLDGTLLVVDAARGRRAPVRRAADAVEKAKGNLLGVVMNRHSSPAYADYARYYGPPAEVPASASPDSSRTA